MKRLAKELDRGIYPAENRIEFGTHYTIRAKIGDMIWVFIHPRVGSVADQIRVEFLEKVNRDN